MTSHWSRDNLGDSDIVAPSITIRIERFLIETPQQTWPSLNLFRMTFWGLLTDEGDQKAPSPPHLYLKSVSHTVQR